MDIITMIVSHYHRSMFLLHFAKYLLFHNLQHLIVHVTNRCNCRCKHCFIDFSNTHDLPLKIIHRCSSQLKDLFWLDIGGGEPFLREDLPKVISAFNAKIIMIPSNGFLTDIIVDQLKEIKKLTDAEVGISFSLEGFENTNDDIRQKGSWNAVWKSFEQVRQLGTISVKINTVLSKQNYAELIPFMKEVKKQKPDFHSIILLRGTPSSPSMSLPDLRVLKAMIPEIIHHQEQYNYGRDKLSTRILRNYHRYAWKLSYETLEKKTQVIPCLAGLAHMVINADGSVSSCELLPAVGHLENQSWAEILQSREYLQQQYSIRQKECFCTHNCAMLDSVLFNPGSLPKLLWGCETL